jgi:methionyl-tRNA formyltransferase
MKKTSETIVFFGSGPVAAKALEKLAADFEIEAVITKPKPEHHKYPFPVLEMAKQLELKTFTPKDVNELRQLFDSKPVSSKLGVVIDYGIIIPEQVIDFFPLGIVNSHFSLLPKYRGADPISFAILNGDSSTGVSLMLIVPALDEGPILAEREFMLPDDISATTLTSELIELSEYLLTETLPKYIKGQIQPYNQSPQGASYSRKLTKKDSVLDWHKPAVELERQVRAFLEWPRSRAELGDTRVVITKSHTIPGNGEPGKLYISSKELGVYTSEGIFVIDQLIPEGKKEMTASAFLAGHNLN